MRIAIDARYLNEQPSPLGHYCENLIEHLAAVDEENEYFVFIHHSFPKRLRVGKNFTVRPVRSDPISWKTLHQFNRRVERTNPDLLHVLYPIVPPGWRGRLLVTVHDLKTLLVEQTMQGSWQLGLALGQAFSKWMFPIAVRRADTIACVSSATRDALTAHFPGSQHKSLVIRSGVEPSFAAPLDDTTRDLVLAKHRPPKRYLFYTGSIRPSKNLPNMLSAFSMLRNSDEAFSTLNFLIDAPGGKQMQELQRLAARMNLPEAVRFIESIGDPERRVFYDQSEALCFVCKNEGFGFPILEAQSSGTPVLAGDSGALPEIAGPGALLVDPDKVPSIVEGMRRILTDTALREDLVRTGYENVKNYSWKTTAEQIRDIYNYVF